MFCFLFVLFVWCWPTYGDVYLHVLRGSNNRLDEANRERNNANRLFDSQNNNRGGYNVGSTIYIEGSQVQLTWTNQHGLGPNPNTPYNEIVLQMMCCDKLRDGTTTNRIPDTATADTDYEYGRQESYSYYQDCKKRERNKGLFTASQQLKGNSAIYTRQNPQGTRYGFECPEGILFSLFLLLFLLSSSFTSLHLHLHFSLLLFTYISLLFSSLFTFSLFSSHHIQTKHT
jgi:hypothetical protein